MSLSYTRAVCYKATGRYAEADKLYREHIHTYRRKVYKDAAESLFGVLITPSIHNRRKILNCLENINDAIKLYGNHKS